MSGCCKPDLNPEKVREFVRQAYAGIAVGGGSCCGPDGSAGCGGGGSAEALAEQIGYSKSELDKLPEGANLGLSCGNPTAIASLQPGETVVDLGAGGGFDVFVAARKVGPAGRAIGVDMTAEMISRARRNAEAYEAETGLTNVEFRLGEIEHLPLADASVDVVLSNCVINLSADKRQVWREVARVLRPGGRVSVSDLALFRPLPEAVQRSIEALVSCVAGAVVIDDTRRMLGEAGLTEIELTPRTEYMQAKAEWNDPLYKMLAGMLPKGTTAGDYLTSLDIRARKPI